jgi:quinol monooxygenase YgiN
VAESVIRAGDPVVVLINVFTVEPEHQQRLVQAWQRGTEEVMRHLPGFVSANIHRSLDGTKVVNYAQWESAEAFAASLRDPQVSGYFNELADIGTPAPTLCEVVSVHRASGDTGSSPVSRQ